MPNLTMSPTDALNSFPLGKCTLGIVLEIGGCGAYCAQQEIVSKVRIMQTDVIYANVGFLSILV